MDLSTSRLLSAVGYALVAFLWQGAAIGIAAAVGLVLCRRYSPSVRYVIGCVALTLMATAPIITFVRAIELPSATAIHILTRSDVAVGQPETASAVVTPFSASASSIEPYLPGITLLWAAGVFTGGLHLFVGWWRLRRMLQSSLVIPPAEWRASVRAIATRLGVESRTRICSSALVGVPGVIGWLYPVILVPASALAALPAPYLDAVLAHELAHLRRRDHLVNALQCALEVLLFYHPAVWWVSQQVRREREHCCDDEAALVCGDTDVYARALVSLEELRGPNPRVAVAANGGRLLGRIRRLVEPSFSGGLSLSGGMIMTLALSFLVLVAGLHVGAAGAPSPVAAIQESIPQPAPAATPAPNRPEMTAVVERVPKLKTSPVPSDVARGQTAIGSQEPQPQAQATGGIDGRVTDPSGGVVPGVSVIIRVAGAREVQQTLVTNARGEFRADNLSPGAYDLALVLTGFRTATGGLTVTAGQRVPVRFRLEVGRLEETMTVAAAAPAAGSTPQAASELLVLQRELAVLQARGYSPQHPDLLRLAERIEAIKREGASTTATAPQVPVRVGGDIKEPVRLKDVKPVYPPDALAAGIQGTVFIEAVLSKDGTVQSARVVQGVTELDDAALSAVTQWVYRPTMLNGQPVEILMTVAIKFVAK